HCAPPPPYRRLPTHSRSRTSASRDASEVSFLNAGIPADGRRLAFAKLRAEIENDDAIDQRHHELHVVLDQEDRQMVRAQRPQQFGQLELLLATQAGRRFVDDE